jgi:hypothetical protein
LKENRKIEMTGRRGKNVSSYWMTLISSENAGNLKIKHWATICGEPEVVGLTYDRLQNE